MLIFYEQKQNAISQSYKRDAKTPQDFASKIDQNTQKDGQTMHQDSDNNECHLYEELCATAVDFQLLAEGMKKRLSICRDEDYRSAESLSCYLCDTLNLRYSDIDRLQSFLNSLRNSLCVLGEKGANGAYSLGGVI